MPLTTRLRNHSVSYSRTVSYEPPSVAPLHGASLSPQNTAAVALPGPWVGYAGNCGACGGGHRPPQNFSRRFSNL